MREQCHQIAAPALFGLLVSGAASFGGMYRPDAWYAGLAKPWFMPPGIAFPTVWSVLYVMIAVAGWSAWRSANSWAVAIWGVSLALNGLWSWLFFGRRVIGLALLDIAGLLACILAFLLVTRRNSPLAFWLFVPYLVWVGFAALLNFEIWRLNG